MSEEQQQLYNCTRQQMLTTPSKLAEFFMILRVPDILMTVAGCFCCSCLTCLLVSPLTPSAIKAESWAEAVILSVPVAGAGPRPPLSSGGARLRTPSSCNPSLRCLCAEATPNSAVPPFDGRKCSSVARRLARYMTVCQEVCLLLCDLPLVLGN